MRSRHFKDFAISGFIYYEGIDVFEKLKIGSKLNLILEPNNKYDPDAVAIYYKDKKLGFIPKAKNKTISQFLRLGYTDIFETKINRISPDAFPYEQIGVLVRIFEKGAKI